MGFSDGLCLTFGQEVQQQFFFDGCEAALGGFLFEDVELGGAQGFGESSTRRHR